jgi:predicted metal-dependent hydrolase
VKTVSGAVMYGQQRLGYEVLFSASRRTLTIEVHPDGRVLVRAPLGCPDALIAERVARRAAWISRQLAEFAAYRPRTPARQYVNGETHLYLGRQYRLRLEAGAAAGVRLAQGRMLVTLPGLPGLIDRGPDPAPDPAPERVRALLYHWYRQRALIIVPATFWSAGFSLPVQPRAR